MQSNIMVAGATGYLGSYITRELQARKYPVYAMGRNRSKLQALGLPLEYILPFELTDPTAFPVLEAPIDTLISTVGITRQKDGLTYEDVDYQANMNLLAFALSHRVRKFIYVSVIDGTQMQEVRMVAAKEKFVRALQAAPIAHTIVRPNAFFSDMKDFLEMAQNGRVFLFGHGQYQLNPIHGRDLARVVVDQIQGSDDEIIAGGPDILTQKELAQMALESWGGEGKIILLPDFIRRWSLRALRLFTPVRIHGPIEFFLTMMGGHHVAPRFGTERLSTFFRTEADRIEEEKGK